MAKCKSFNDASSKTDGEKTEKFREILGQNLPDDQIEGLLKICHDEGITEVDDVAEYLEEEHLKPVLKPAQIKKFMKYKNRQPEQGSRSVGGGDFMTLISNSGGTIGNVVMEDNLINTGGISNTNIRIGHSSASKSKAKAKYKVKGPAMEKMDGPTDQAQVSIISLSGGGTIGNVRASNNMFNAGDMENASIDIGAGPKVVHHHHGPEYNVKDSMITANQMALDHGRIDLQQTDTTNYAAAPKSDEAT